MEQRSAWREGSTVNSRQSTVVVAFLLIAAGLLACGGRSGQKGSWDAGARPDGSRQDSPRPRLDGPPRLDLPIIVFDSWPADAGPPSPQRVARACARAASCVADFVDPVSALASRCVDWFSVADWPASGYEVGPRRELLDRLLLCAEKKGGCKELFDCYGGNWFDATVCRIGGCQGDRLVSISNNALYLDCGELAPGGTCMELATGAQRACCARETCALSSPGGSTTCSGSEGTTCMPPGMIGTEGIIFHFDCAPTGRVCSTSGSLCVGTGPPCPPQHKTSCQGSVATFCSGGKLASVDCSTNPLRAACSPGAYDYMSCGAQGTECNESYVGACQGSSLLVCVNGYKVAVDCTAIGFDLCATPAGVGYARCMYAL